MITKKIDRAPGRSILGGATCTICGNGFRPPFLWWLLLLDGEQIGQLCEECGKADKQTLHQRLQTHIEYLQHQVKWLKALQENIDEMVTDISFAKEMISSLDKGSPLVSMAQKMVGSELKSDLE